MKMREYFAGVGLVLLLVGQIAVAGTTGKIVGSVKDKASGEPLIGANVVLEGTNLGAATDIDGYFVIINVPPGIYRMSVFYVGYATTTVENVRINIDRTTTQDIYLTPSEVEGQEVVVEAERPAIELDRTHTSAVMNAQTVDLMPVTEVAEVIALQAGIVNTGGQLHFRGGRAREVSYVIDGVPVTNNFSENGGSLVQVDNNMIAELEVISGTFNAEYGQAQSGVVNIVTRRPDTRFSAKLNTYVGDWLSNKDDIFLGVNDFNPAGERNVEFNITGPLLSDKVGFIISGRVRQFESLDWYERRFNTVDGWRIAAYREWAQRNQVTSGSLIHIPDSLLTGDRSRGPLRTSDYGSLQAKLNWAISSKFTLTYTMFGSFQETIGPQSGITGNSDQFYKYAPDDFGTRQDWSYSQFLRFQHFPSESFFYNITASYQRDDGDFFYRKDNKIARFPGDDGIILAPFNPSSDNSIGQTYSLGGTTGLYGNKAGREYVDQYHLQGDLNWQIDKHNLIKAGFSYTQHVYDIFNRGFQFTEAWGTNGSNGAWPLQNFIDPGGMSFDEYWTELNLYWRNWERIFETERIREITGDPDLQALYDDYQIKPVEMAAYLQDKMELGKDIIVNAGVRLDVFDPNERVPINLRALANTLGSPENLREATVKSQLSPRLGISFPISANGAFHASYGHFFQMPPHARMFNEPLVTVNRAQLENRRLGNADLKPERTIAYEIGLQQAITDDIAVDVTAYYKDFKNLLGIEKVTTVDGVGYERYVNRDYGISKGLTLNITKRRGLVNGGINYTLAFANGSNSDPNELLLIEAATRIGGDVLVFPDRRIAPLNWDQRHTVNAYVNFVKPQNWSIGVVGFLDSGTPFSPKFLERFDISEREYRNRALKPSRWNVDLKAKKHLNLGGVKSSLFLKVDNLFDHLNHENVYAVSGRADENSRLPEEGKVIETELSNEGLFTLDEIDLNPDFFSPPRKVQFGLEIEL